MISCDIMRYHAIIRLVVVLVPGLELAGEPLEGLRPRRGQRSPAGRGRERAGLAGLAPSASGPAGARRQDAQRAGGGGGVLAAGSPRCQNGGKSRWEECFGKMAKGFRRRRIFKYSRRHGGEGILFSAKGFFFFPSPGWVTVCAAYAWGQAIRHESRTNYVWMTYLLSNLSAQIT